MRNLKQSDKQLNNIDYFSFVRRKFRRKMIGFHLGWFSAIFLRSQLDCLVSPKIRRKMIGLQLGWFSAIFLRSQLNCLLSPKIRRKMIGLHLGWFSANFSALSVNLCLLGTPFNDEKLNLPLLSTCFPLSEISLKKVLSTMSSTYGMSLLKNLTKKVISNLIIKSSDTRKPKGRRKTRRKMIVFNLD